MTKRVQHLRHAAAAAEAFLGYEGEITVNLTRQSLHVHNGATPGGMEQARADLDNVPDATTSVPGRMSAADKAQLIDHESRVSDNEDAISSLGSTVSTNTGDIGTNTTEIALRAHLVAAGVEGNITQLDGDGDLEDAGIAASAVVSKAGAATLQNKTLDATCIFSPFIGKVFLEPVNGDTTGFLACDGRTLDSVANTEYAALYARIGTTYGGTGADDFNIPDYRGEFIRIGDNLGTAAGAASRDPDAGSRTDRGDGTTGNNVGTRQAGAVAQHNHNANVRSGTINDVIERIAGWLTAGDSESLSTASDTSAIDNYGGNETRPRNVYSNACIYYGG